MEGRSLPEVDAEQYAALVGQASDEEIAQGLEQSRDAIIGQIFQRMPERFSPQKAGDLNAVIEWRVGGRSDGGHDRWQLVIENGTCRSVRDGDAEPRLTFTVGGVDFIKLITGNASGPLLFTIGRLKIKGDLLLAARVAGFFDVPRSQS